MSIHALLMSFGERPHLVLAVVFAAACTESIAAIGTFVPAGVVMFAAGALIGAGAVDGWIMIGVATLGAIAGDGLSYELGRRYHTQVGAWSRSHGHEAAWLRGEQFVARHGGKSIVFARFFAPVRAIVPLVVGTARMARAKFYPINVVSALAWAPTHIAPGILFGASASLAEAVSARLAAIFVILALLLWLIVRLVRLMVERGLPMTKRVAARVTRHWARRLPWLGTQLRKIVDLDSPEFPTLAALVLLFIGSVWLFGGVLQDVVANDPLMRADTALYAFLQSLHIAPIDSLMTGLSALNDRSVVYAVSAVVLVWLIWKRSWKSAVWWIAVVGAGVAVAVSRVQFQVHAACRLDSRYPHTPLPDGRAAFSLLIFAFAGWLLCRQQTLRWRAGVATAVALWIVMGSIADLYLGRAWLSGLLGGWALGLAWLSLFAGTYTSRHVDDDLSPKAMALLITGTLAVAGAGYLSGHTQPVKAGGSPIARLALSLSVGQWLDNGWQLLPARRMEVGGDEEEPLPLQWAASNDAIIGALKQAGWQPAVAWTARSALGWLLSQPQVDQLPVLPKYSAGEPSQLARADRSRLIAQPSGATPLAFTLHHSRRK
ncbi:VTT domain-containing protein [Caballeronia sp. PC1]|uniref:VTT domain-containing protein n=1 Tax=Caballeronia sp. PC1 TaxID=2906765 RepID=UPI001F299870|nr:VTT domain-containing protein [Caballeronia sp. PC1]MCE4547891.1 VTT domain-containing protein [Caballeronia sp. PC1]